VHQIEIIWHAIQIISEKQIRRILMPDATMVFESHKSVKPDHAGAFFLSLNSATSAPFLMR
jgi:hypothetical protein